MCVICIFEPGMMPPYEMIENAVYNNEDGFGLVLKDTDTNKLQIIKSTEDDLKAGANPQKIYELLDEHKDLQRFLHVRNKTEGSITEENVQPFCAYSSNKRQVYFMHNGTLHEFKPKGKEPEKWLNGVKIEAVDAETASDSKKFNDEFLAPLLLRMSGDKGKADISDRVFQNMVAKFWGAAIHNRGILIANDLDYVLINSAHWETIKYDGDKFFLASNNSYFDKVTRGSEFERRKKAKEEEERKARTARFQEKRSENKSVVQIRDLDFRPRFKSITKDDMADLMSDVDVYSTDGLVALSNLTGNEIEQFVKFHPEVVSELLVHLTDEFAKLNEKYQKLVVFQEQKSKVG